MARAQVWAARSTAARARAAGSMAPSPAPHTTPLRSSPWQQKAHTGATATKPTGGISEKVAANHHQKTTSAILVQAAPGEHS